MLRLWILISDPHCENLKNVLPKSYLNKLHDEVSATFQREIQSNAMQCKMYLLVLTGRINNAISRRCNLTDIAMKAGRVELSLRIALALFDAVADTASLFLLAKNESAKKF